ncbi:MAG TPA: NAD(+) diphosphatase [Pseudonocardia sp.]|nr:NAD(+) diphosphatase [Pseudonocardia sp.]
MSGPPGASPQAGTPFGLLDPPVLSRSAVLRDERLRTDAARQVAGWRTARLVVVDEAGRAAVDWGDGRRPGGPWDTVSGGGARLLTRPSTGTAPPEDAVLLGEHEGTAYWAVRGRVDLVAGEDPTDWADLRTAGAALDALGAGLLTSAVAVLNWHDAARFCGRDGSPTRPGNAGWHRTCEANGHEDYPRTDPAVICLVHDGGSGDAARVLLARQPVWPEGRFSVLAGFVEAGESLEACVAREIGEEVGVPVRDVRYLGSQAWPFPRSLMIGFHAVADPDLPLRPADGEIAEAMWVSRADLRRALDRGDWGGRGEPGERLLLLPGKVSIARSMLEAWAALP